MFGFLSGALVMLVSSQGAHLKKFENLCAGLYVCHCIAPTEFWEHSQSHIRLLVCVFSSGICCCEIDTCSYFHSNTANLLENKRLVFF